ncbi:ArsR/SmtB family transcription factor [Paenibacillus koleovorans]|uniref:ArsR/SmtB family transcription factor n=1 Tax=Paenibacillus koleovorans TaxID=121608 RepID=UPI000FDB1485|nr:metalloregulator ArsR/SmtB family transcription factor [Paenibacillus koleovorans]
MVNHDEEKLDHIFHALADPTRRAMVRMIATQEHTVSELAEPFDMSLAAVSKHIKVLEQAGLLQKTIKGRTHSCRLDAQTLLLATQWLNVYERYWSARFDLLERELKLDEEKKH